jgi:hypothetical protein
MPALDFTDLSDVEFVGDGTYLRFSSKYVEIRKSGTDAKLKAYAAGDDKKECEEYAKALAFYSGDLTPTYLKLIGEKYLENVQQKAKEIYFKFLRD